MGRWGDTILRGVLSLEGCHRWGGGPQEVTLSGFPVRLEKLEKWEGIFQSGKSQGILNRLEKSGKITQNTGKTSGNFRKMLCYFLMIFKNELCIICLNGSSFQSKQQNIKKYWKMEKDTGKVSEFCQSRKVGTLIMEPPPPPPWTDKHL